MLGMSFHQCLIRALSAVKLDLWFLKVRIQNSPDFFAYKISSNFSTSILLGKIPMSQSVTPAIHQPRTHQEYLVYTSRTAIHKCVIHKDLTGSLAYLKLKA